MNYIQKSLENCYKNSNTSFILLRSRQGVNKERKDFEVDEDNKRKREKVFEKT